MLGSLFSPRHSELLVEGQDEPKTRRQDGKREDAHRCARADDLASVIVMRDQGLWKKGMNRSIGLLPATLAANLVDAHRHGIDGAEQCLRRKRSRGGELDATVLADEKCLEFRGGDTETTTQRIG